MRTLKITTTLCLALALGGCASAFNPDSAEMRYAIDISIRNDEAAIKRARIAVANGSKSAQDCLILQIHDGLGRDHCRREQAKRREWPTILASILFMLAVNAEADRPNKR